MVCGPPHGGACCGGAWPPSWLGIVCWCVAPLTVGRAVVVHGPPHGGACPVVAGVCVCGRRFAFGWLCPCLAGSCGPASRADAVCHSLLLFRGCCRPAARFPLFALRFPVTARLLAGCWRLSPLSCAPPPLRLCCEGVVVAPLFFFLPLGACWLLLLATPHAPAGLVQVLWVFCCSVPRARSTLPLLRALAGFPGGSSFLLPPSPPPLRLVPVSWVSCCWFTRAHALLCPWCALLWCSPAVSVPPPPRSACLWFLGCRAAHFPVRALCFAFAAPFRCFCVPASPLPSWFLLRGRLRPAALLSLCAPRLVCRRWLLRTHPLLPWFVLRGCFYPAPLRVFRLLAAARTFAVCFRLVPPPPPPAPRLALASVSRPSSPVWLGALPCCLRFFAVPCRVAPCFFVLRVWCGATLCCYEPPCAAWCLPVLCGAAVCGLLCCGAVFSAVPFGPMSCGVAACCSRCVLLCHLELPFSALCCVPWRCAAPLCVSLLRAVHCCCALCCRRGAVLLFCPICGAALCCAVPSGAVCCAVRCAMLCSAAVCCAVYWGVLSWCTVPCCWRCVLLFCLGLLSCVLCCVP